MDPLFAPIILSVGIGTPLIQPGNTGDHQTTQELPSLELQLGHEDLPLYGWGSVGTRDITLLGQNLGPMSGLSGGLGVKHNMSDKLSLFAEAGYSFNNTSTEEIIQQEIVFTRLVDRHQVHPSRPIPVDVNFPYDQESYATTYKVDNNMVYRIGIGYSLMDNLEIDAHYTFSQVPTKMEMYDEERREAGGGYWEEHETIDSGGFGIRMMWRF